MKIRYSAWAIVIFAFSQLLLFSEEANEKPFMRVEQDDATIRMYRGDQMILQYNKKPTEEAADNEAFYTRSGYIHPVYSPKGHEVTGDYPKDHPHQHALFFAWTQTEFEGRSPEFWNQRKEAGRVSFVRTAPDEPIQEGPQKCSFAVEHLWEDLTSEDGPRSVLSEYWWVTAYDAGPDRFIFDIKTSQNMLGPEPLQVLKYHYGGMAIRGPDQWLDPDKEATLPSTILTSEGLNRIEGNHSRPKWVAMSGPVDGGTAGIAVLSDKGNFRFPQWVRLHPNKPYFVFAPMVEEPFLIQEREPYMSCFRYVVYDGESDPKLLNEEWESMHTVR